MINREEYEKRKAAAIAKGNEVKERLGINVEHYITDWEEKLKGNNVSYPIGDVPPDELQERLFKIQTMVIEDYAASIGATVEIKYFDDVGTSSA